MKSKSHLRQAVMEDCNFLSVPVLSFLYNMQLVSLKKITYSHFWRKWFGFGRILWSNINYNA